MRAETAAAYVDEESVEAFRRAVGTLYPRPRRVAGRGDRWLNDELDLAIDRLAGQPETIRDIRRVMKPTSWPKYVIEKGLPSGKAAYYWYPPNRDLKAGFALRREALGTDYGAAIARANELNRHLDDWTKGRGADKELDLQPGIGTMAWLVERYKRSRAWEKVSRRSRYEYDRAFKLVAHAGVF